MARTTNAQAAKPHHHTTPPPEFLKTPFLRLPQQAQDACEF
jgi:hypothetical protein